jgi:butyrate kinase
MAYQISKEIGAMATVCRGSVDAVILTGGLARPPLTEWITENVGWIGRVVEKPGEREMEALALAAARHLFGVEELQDY